MREEGGCNLRVSLYRLVLGNTRTLPRQGQMRTSRWHGAKDEIEIGKRRWRAKDDTVDGASEKNGSPTGTAVYGRRPMKVSGDAKFGEADDESGREPSSKVRKVCSIFSFSLIFGGLGVLNGKLVKHPCPFFLTLIRILNSAWQVTCTQIFFAPVPIADVLPFGDVSGSTRLAHSRRFLSQVRRGLLLLKGAICRTPCEGRTDISLI